MSCLIERSLSPAEDYLSLIRSKYGNTPETKQFISDTQHGLSLVSKSNSSQSIFFHAKHKGRLIGHMALIPTNPKEAFFGFFELVEYSCMNKLWQALIAEAKEAGITKLFGPINGSVWYPYRVISETNEEPFFLCEPLSTINYNNRFKELKPYKTIEYYSALRTKYDAIINITNLSAMAAARANILIEERTLTPTLKEQLYHLVSTIFSQNPGYTQLSMDDFNKLYINKANNTQHAVYTATSNDELIGFCFNIITDNKLIMKTIGILPEWQEKGLGNALVNAVHKHAKTQGIKKVIYALIRSDNKIQKFPKDDVTIFRKYAAFMFLVS